MIGQAVLGLGEGLTCPGRSPVVLRGLGRVRTSTETAFESASVE